MARSFGDLSPEEQQAFVGLQQEALDKCQEYYDALTAEIGLKGFTWLHDTETGQLMVYTRGDYTKRILQMLEEIDDGNRTRFMGN